MITGRKSVSSGFIEEIYWYPSRLSGPIYVSLDDIFNYSYVYSYTNIDDLHNLYEWAVNLSYEYFDGWRVNDKNFNIFKEV